MTDNVKLDLYNDVKAVLVAMGDFKNVLKYNSQEEADPKEIKRRYPQAWIEFASIEWEPSKLEPNQMNVTQEQKGDFQLAIHVATFSLSDDNVTFGPDLALINKVYRELTMLQGAGYTPLQRLTEDDDINNNNVRDWVIIFSTTATEGGISKEEVDAAPVTIQVNPREA